jgi:putative flippase GtrA
MQIHLFIKHCFFWFKENINKLVAWVLSGFSLVLLSNLITYIFVDYFSIIFVIASTFAGISCNILRFFINNFWIFKEKKFRFKSFIRFQIGNSFSFIIWWLVANLLVKSGLNYLLAINIATLVSTLLNLFFNFFWVWETSKKRG